MMMTKMTVIECESGECCQTAIGTSKSALLIIRKDMSPFFELYDLLQGSTFSKEAGTSEERSQVESGNVLLAVVLYPNLTKLYVL
ncbi:MAG: hypothetical protein GDA38_17005 [Hormoscilla sp. SP12CHS1]|nr:hypothetical protein [Hormoscilla sp. SP12CHS1]